MASEGDPSRSHLFALARRVGMFEDERRALISGQVLDELHLATLVRTCTHAPQLVADTPREGARPPESKIVAKKFEVRTADMLKI
jgi:hypothetical protein